MPNSRAPRRFIEENMRLRPVPALPDIVLYGAHPGSGLRRLAEAAGGAEAAPPYWAWLWAGGAVLARHFRERPESVADRRVLDLGAGSGIVGIAALRAGAASVLAAETDRYGLAALALNAAANGVMLTITGEDLTGGPPPEVDLVAVGDLFYDAALALRVTAFLDRCQEAGIEVLIGDPGRAHLPLPRLRVVAEYAVADFGDAPGGTLRTSSVFALTPQAALAAV